MKFPKNADIEEYKASLQSGALKGAAFGTAVGISAAFYLKRRTSFFHGAGGFQKMLVYAAPAAFCTIVNMELSSRAFEEHMRLKQHGQSEADEKPAKDLSFSERATQWASLNKYKLVVAGWAASLGGSFWLVNRDKYMTKAQKIVQARVYAQGATVALLLITVALSVGDKGFTDKQKADIQSHSWERDLSFVEAANHGAERVERGERAGSSHEKHVRNVPGHVKTPESYKQKHADRHLEASTSTQEKGAIRDEELKSKVQDHKDNKKEIAADVAKRKDAETYKGEPSQDDSQNGSNDKSQDKPQDKSDDKSDESGKSQDKSEDKSDKSSDKSDQSEKS